MLNERDDVHSAALADFDACFSLSAQNRGQTLIGTPGMSEKVRSYRGCS